MVFGPALDIMSPWLHFTKVFQLFFAHFVSMASFGYGFSMVSAPGLDINIKVFCSRGAVHASF